MASTATNYAAMMQGSEAERRKAATERPSITDWQNRAERAEAECRELREKIINMEDDLRDAAREADAWAHAAQYGE